MYILYLFLLHTITCNPIIVQMKPTVTSTNETSISICTCLGAIVCSITTLINIYRSENVFMYRHGATS